jgi:hypothetical protein
MLRIRFSRLATLAKPGSRAPNTSSNKIVMIRTICSCDGLKEVAGRLSSRMRGGAGVRLADIGLACWQRARTRKVTASENPHVDFQDPAPPREPAIGGRSTFCFLIPQDIYSERLSIGSGANGRPAARKYGAPAPYFHGPDGALVGTLTAAPGVTAKATPFRRVAWLPLLPGHS